MPRYKLTIEYAGTRYSGWQVQKNARTVQGELQRAVQEASGAPAFDLQGSGRTDAGVHALEQVAHLDIPTNLAARDAAAADQRRAARRHQRARHRGRSAPVPRAARRRVAQLSLPGGAPPHGVREAVRVVGEGGPRRASGCARPRPRFAGMHDFRSFSDSDPGETSTKVLLDDVRGGRRGRPDPRARGRVALHLEDGAANRRRAGGGRPRRVGAGGRGGVPRQSRRRCRRG